MGQESHPMNETTNKVARELLAECRKHKNRDTRDVLDAIADPRWEESSARNDWRNGVGPTVVSLWDHLALEPRLVAYLSASVSTALE